MEIGLKYVSVIPSSLTLAGFAKFSAPRSFDTEYNLQPLVGANEDKEKVWKFVKGKINSKCRTTRSRKQLLSGESRRVLSIMPKIPEISVGIQMERSVSVSSDRNIRDHFWRWSTYFGWNIPIEIRRSIFDKQFFALISEFGNDHKWQELFLLVGAV